VPVALKLSKRFYDRFGDEIVSEFVELLNQVDATYKSELHQLIDVHFARFDAKLEQRTAELRVELKQDVSALDSRMRVEFADQRTWMERNLREQTRFFFLAWAVLLASNIALWFK
jgi:biopolymer transport protein ExbB/TolQ